MYDAMPLLKYVRKIEKALRAGNATEHTHRPALKELLEAVGKTITATNEPRREKCGAPDYVISADTKHGPLTIGYVEAKDVGKPLDEIERSEQLTRYRAFLPNLILTDYLEFRWYVEGKPRGAARLARVAEAGKLRRNKGSADAVMELLRGFLEREPVPIASPQELAQRLAWVTHMIRDIIIKAIEGGHASNTLRDLRKAFAQTLIPDLDQPEKIADFADMYAQTIAYGLFAARCNHRGPGPFRRLGAAAEIPKTNPFLRKLFETITGADLDEEPYAGFVDDASSLLAHTDMASVLEHFGRRIRREDPVVHFYETFLATYDPKLREARGVYYTPEPVVSYIVRSVDHILKTRFGCEQGLADASVCEYQRKDGNGKQIRDTSPRVLILDPACGTGTFLYAVVDLIREQFIARGDAGMWSGYVRKHLLPRLFGFELLMAPYAVAHFKLGMQLAGQDLPSDALREKWAYDFAGGKKDRLKVFLTNTLEGIERAIPALFGWYKIISDEANQAREIKRDLPIMVVIGNPPYSVASYNRSSWIERLMQDYKRTVRQEESQIQGLSNDYIKFLRFAQWRIDRTKNGVLGFITGHGYINGPQARDMRASLLRSFDEIHILNLHGSARRTTTRTSEERDEPVFNIQQGTAIVIALKGAPTKKAKLLYAEHKGSLREKLEYLSAHDVSTTTWTKVAPCPPDFYFVPHGAHSTELENEFRSFHSLPEFFGTGNRQNDKELFWATGFASQQDQFAIAFDDLEVRSNIEKLLASDSEETLRACFRLCTTNQWSYSRAIAELKTGAWKKQITDCAFRPFDLRRTVFDRNVVSILRSTVMSNLQHEGNMALVASRVINDADYAHVFVAKHPVDKILLSTKTSTNAYVFPLYLYPDPDTDGELFANGTDRHVNLSPKFLKEMGNRLRLSFVPDGTGDLKKTFGPEDVFNYIYAIFHSPTYRERYAELLKIDFPRVPLTGDKELFRALCSKGKELVGLHLLESPKVSRFITRYPVPGDDLVAKGHPRYVAPGKPEPGTGKPLKKGRVYISSDTPRSGKKGQYFEGVPPEVWEFHIGGYQVCEKWLKDRRGRKLSYDDLTHYQNVVVALKETIRLMQEIDAAIPDWPESMDMS